MKTRAAVAYEAGKPLAVEELELDGPREGERLVEIKATGICHTDEFTLSGADPEGLFPAVLGREGAGVAVDTGPGVAGLTPGDRVIPLYTPECRQCAYCLSGSTNLSQAIRATQGRGSCRTGRAASPSAAKGCSITWARRPSRTSPWLRRSRWRKSARTCRSTRSATSAAASPPVPARQ